jgi:hypothetical protein
MTEDSIDQDQVNEWCRHIDGITWTMGGIMLGAIGGLALYAIDHSSLWICLGGLFVTVVTGFLLASFRAIRRRLHAHMDPHLVDLLRPPHGFKQWPWILGLLAVLAVVWVRLLCIANKHLCILWVILGIVSVVLLIHWFRRADLAHEAAENTHEPK